MALGGVAHSGTTVAFLEPKACVFLNASCRQCALGARLKSLPEQSSHWASTVPTTLLPAGCVDWVKGWAPAYGLLVSCQIRRPIGSFLKNLTQRCQDRSRWWEAFEQEVHGQWWQGLVS